MHKKLVSLIALATSLVIQTGCINISDEAMAGFGAALGHGIGEIVKDVQTLSFATSWYYNVNDRWPSDFSELKQFIAERDAPLNLDRYKGVQFEPNEDGSVECIYTMAILDSQHRGSFSLTVENANEMDLDMIKLNDGHLHIEPPKAPEPVQPNLNKA